MKNKYLKAPVLSTGFSENEKSAKNRFSNILNKKGSAKVIVIIVLIVLIITIGTAVSINDKKTNVNSNNVSGDIKESGENTQTQVTDYKKQIDVIMNNIDMWNLYTEDNTYNPYGYAITDLDQNGRLEIIASSCQGTGLYTYSNYYEVNERIDGLNKIERNNKEGNSEADIMIATAKVFIDKDKNEYHYIFDDLIRNGAAEYYENKQDIVLKNGKLSENTIAYKNTKISNSDSYEVILEDASRNKITLEDYQLIENKLFSNLELKLVNVEWITSNDIDFSNVSGDELREKLVTSYEGFRFFVSDSGISLNEKFSLIGQSGEKAILNDNISNFNKEVIKSEFDNGDGYMWRTYTYDDITITALLDYYNGNYYINKIETTSPNYKTIKGISVGDSLEKLQGTYIEDLTRVPDEVNNITYTYKEPLADVDGAHGSEIDFYIKDGKIEKISLLYIAD